MSPKLLTTLGVLLILIGLALVGLHFAGAGGSLYFAASAFMSGGIALAMGQRKKTGN